MWLDAFVLLFVVSVLSVLRGFDPSVANSFLVVWLGLCGEKICVIRVICVWMPSSYVFVVDSFFPFPPREAPSPFNPVSVVVVDLEL